MIIRSFRPTRPSTAPLSTPSPAIGRIVSALFGDLYRSLLWLGMGIYTWIFAGLAIAQHQGMRTHKADLGQIDQAVWNSSRGRFVEMTDFGFLATRMTDHVEPILALISPIYWLWDDPRAILILQTIFVATGAWFLYHFTLQQWLATLPLPERDKIWHTDALLGLARPVALCLAVAYLLAPPLQAAILTEFHAVPLMVPLALWALWAVDARRWGHFAAAVFLVAMVKEETALLAAGLGVWAIWRITVVSRLNSDQSAPAGLRPLLLAGALTLFSLTWFYIATFVIVPAHAEPVYGIAESSYFARYGALGDSPADILRSFFTQPGLVWEIATEPVRLDYLRRLLMPFGYLSLLAPDVILLSLPVLLANQLSAYPAQYYGEYHYSAPVFVYFAAAAAVGSARLWRLLAHPLSRTSAAFQHLPTASAPVMNMAAAFQNARTALRPLVVAGLCLWLLLWGGLSYREAGRGPWGPRLDATPVTSHHRLLPHFVAQIPAEARVTATAAVHPHVSHRRFVYQFPMGLDAPTPPHQQADWALLNVTMAVDMAPGDLRAQVQAMLAGEWGVVDAADGFLLLHKGAAEKSIPADFYSFTTAPAPDSQELSPAPLTLLTTELIDRPYWRATQIISTWETGPEFDPAHTSPRLAVYAPDGNIVQPDINATAPALTWSPPTEWMPGHRPHITTLPHYLPAVWGLVVHDTPQPRLLAAYLRGANDVLHPLPLGPDQGQAQEIAARLGLQAHPAVTFELPASPSPSATVDPTIELRAWTSPAYRRLPVSPVGESDAPGGGVHVFMEWHLGDGEWPEEINVFVHLRAGDENHAQADGRPRYFAESAPVPGKEAQDEAHDNTHILWDWRQLILEDSDLEVARLAPYPVEWTLFIGLYHTSTGTRAELYDTEGNSMGNELELGRVRLAAPPIPDQTCALIPATCGAQFVLP